MKKLIIFIIIALMITSFPTYANYELKTNYPKYVNAIELNELNNLINFCERHMQYAEDLTEAALNLGYETSHPVVELGRSEYEMASRYYNLYKYKYKLWENKWIEYPVATEIWTHLKSFGYSDVVCAGILGNIMAETGANTLDIQYWLYSKDNVYYGICQWNTSYYKEVKDLGLKEQLDFLINRIVYEIDTFGYTYAEGFRYKDFVKLNSYEETTTVFAKCFERCSPRTYQTRINNAKIAYEYFVD